MGERGERMNSSGGGRGAGEGNGTHGALHGDSTLETLLHSQYSIPI